MIKFVWEPLGLSDIKKYIKKNVQPIYVHLG